MIWVNQIIQGLLTGGYYALLAAGLSFLFGVMRLINLAHGSLVVLSAFVLLVIDHALGLSPFLGVLLMLPAMAAIAALLQILVFERSLRASLLVPLLATFGIALIVDNGLFAAFGPDTRSFANAIGMLAYSSFTLTRSISVARLDVLIFATAVIVLGAMHLMLRLTASGRRLRATASDEEAASLAGVDPWRTRIAAAAIAGALIGIAGCALGMQASFTPYSGPPQLIAAFETVVIGGTGSLWGTLIGGMILGVAQALGAAVNPHFSQIAGHCVFLAVLVLRLRDTDGPIARLRAALRSPGRAA